MSKDKPQEVEQRGSVGHDKEGHHHRGRKGPTRLKTNVQDIAEQTPIDSSRREPSPYAFTPSSNKSRFSGDYFLSPDSIPSATWQSPTQKTFQAGRPKQAGTTKARWSDDERESRYDERDRSRHAPKRPPVVRHASAMADPGSSRRPGNDYRFRPDPSSDESDFEPSITRSNRGERPRRYSLEKLTRPPTQEDSASRGYRASDHAQDEKPSMKRRTLSPPPRTSSAYNSQAAPLPSPPISRTSLDLDAYFLNNLPKQRAASYRPSPTTSPYSSPPRSPIVNEAKITTTSSPTGPRSRPISRPASPLPIYSQSHQSPRMDSSWNAQVYPPLDGQRSQRSSPLPSPRLDAPDPTFGPRIDVQVPSPANAGSAYSYASDSHHRSSSSRPSPTPFLSSQTLRTPGNEHHGRSHSFAEDKRPVSTAGASFDPPKSPTSRSRPTTPVSSNGVARTRSALPACPRTNYVIGYNDWHTLDGRPSFNVCPSCFEHAVGSRYKTWFPWSTPKPHGNRTKCDFGAPWVRIAWVKMIEEQRKTPDVLYAVASVNEQPCPGRIGAIRPWHHLHDPDTGKRISNFDVCPCCVRVIEAIFPSLRGVFQYTHLHNPVQERTCDLRYDSKRFAGYVDILERIANKAEAERRPPRMHRLADHALKMSRMQECSKDDMVLGQAWHIMPRIPQFTVCEECYDEVVWPAIDAGSLLAGQFNRTMMVVGSGGISCQLYSPRMRQVFKDAVRRNDLEYLREQAVHRYNMERALQARHAQLQKYRDVEEIARIVKEWKKWE